MHDVFAVFTCTLLHRELQDYSLGQIAFAVFQIICYHTAAFPSKHFERLLKDEYELID